MKHLFTFLAALLICQMLVSQTATEDNVNKWNLSIFYDLNHLNYSFETYHFGVDKHWGIESFNALDLSLSYNVFKALNIGTGLTVNMHSITYDRIYLNLFFRNYEKFRKYSFYPELKIGLIRGKSVHPGTLNPTLFGSISVMMEMPIGDNFILAFGPGFTYFTDAFTYGYWEVRYAPILGKTIFVDDPVQAKNFLVNFRIGVKYGF